MSYPAAYQPVQPMIAVLCLPNTAWAACLAVSHEP